MEMQRIEQATSPAMFGNILARTFRRLDAIGRFDVLSEARTLYDRSQELRQARLDAPDRFDADRRAVLDGLVKREIEPSQAIEQMADISRVADQRGAIPALLRDASDRAMALSWSSVCAYGDALVTDVHDMVDELVKESVKVAQSIPHDVRDDEKAVQSGSKIASGWARLRAIKATLEIVYELVDELRLNGALPSMGEAWPEFLDPAEYRYRYLIDSRELRHVPEPLQIAEAVRLGAEPGLYSAESVRAFRMEREQAAHAATA